MQKLTGSTGSTYEVEVYPMSKFGSFFDLDEIEAVYMFVRITTDVQTLKRKFRAVYVGETKDVNDRLREGHHRIADIRKRAATHIFIYRDEEDAFLESEGGRLFIEDDLIQSYHPLCQKERWTDKPRR